MYTTTHWLPVVICIQYKVLVTVFKAYHSGTPQYLADLIKKHSPVRKLRSSHNLNLLEELKYTGEKFGFKSFCVAGPRFGTDFLLNSGRLVHWTHSRNTFVSKTLHRKLTSINFSYLYYMNCTYPIACYEMSIIAAFYLSHTLD